MSCDGDCESNIERVRQPRRWDMVLTPTVWTQSQAHLPTIPSSTMQPIVQTRNTHINKPLRSLHRIHGEKFGLGVNKRNGRLQWCPGFNCYQFFIILPVVLLPVTFILVLLMRMDGLMLMASRIRQYEHNQQPLQPLMLATSTTTDGDVDDTNVQLPVLATAQIQYDTPLNIYDSMISDSNDNSEYVGQNRNIDKYLLSQQLMLSYGQHQQLLQRQEALLAQRQRQLIHERVLNEEERIKRCIVSIKFGLSETLDVEERELMKDARTSFLPQEPIMAIPHDCLNTLQLSTITNEKELSSAKPEYEEANNYLKRHFHRRSADLRSMKREETTPQHEDLSEAVMNDKHTVENEGIMDDHVSKTESEQEADRMRNSILANKDEAQLIDIVSGLQSFWNEEGTMMSIRQAQSNTMRSYMDIQVNPCQDFYKFACGNWERMHPIPRDKAGFDTFEMLRENLDAVLKQLLESKDLDSTKRKVTSLRGNNFDEDNDGNNGNNNNADIVKSLMGIATATAEKQTIAVKKYELEEKTRIRRHILSHRQELGRLLSRFKRQMSSTKRKHLISLINLAGESSNIAANTSTTIIGSKKSNINIGENQNINNIKRREPSAQQKAKYLYQSCTNTRLLQRRGIQPLLRLIDQLGGWPVLNANWNVNQFDWLNLTAQLRRYNNDILIVQWVGPDIKNSDENVIQFDQTSLGLPTREYFLQDMNVKYLQAYQRFASEIMHKLGASMDQAHKTANELISFETQLAQITSPAEQRLNVTKLYKRMTLRQLNEAVPEIDWLRYLSILQQREVHNSEEVVIYAMDYMVDLVALLAETEPRIVANYLLWRFVRHRINNVDERFEDIKQNFYHALFGREESPQRWKVCIAQVNTNMGMALGSMFVSKYFDENSKRDTLKMTHELQEAFREILQTTDWLDISTKHLAELKVNAMSLKIGYPDFILNNVELNEKYAGIEIDPERYFENTLNVLLHTAQTEQNKLHEAVNKTAWQTAPAIVNAYYSRNKNQIMFPAGILQPPFYHRYFPRSLNFGGIGVVIGHELTHGFDDKGRLFDRNGSIHKWWTDTSIKGFDERARCIIAQYSNYTVGEVGITLNGESTQGENIADNGGIRQAFHAYKAWLHNNPEAARNERLPGLNMTGEQLFFLNFGQVWCGAMRPEAVRNKLNTAIHSPGRFRVIGTLSNSNDFAREFHCPLGSPMNPVHKCSVW